MTVMYSFCFYYSVRLGSIIVAFTCMLQCVTAFVACIVGITDLSGTSSSIDHWLHTSDFKMTKDIFVAMRNDPHTFLTAFIVILTIYFFTCVILVYAAFQCDIKYVYPFLILDCIRLILLSVVLVIVLMLIKQNTLNLGVIIGSSILGGFTLLYLWYQWCCVLSFWQIVREIERLDKRLVTNASNIPFTVSEGLQKHKSFYTSPYYMPNVTL